MSTNWFSRLVTRVTRKPGRGVRRRRWWPWIDYNRTNATRLRVEPLEDRTAPAVITWDVNTTNFTWTTASNWVGGVLPGLNDDAVIPDLAGTPTISLPNLSGTTSVRSVTAAEKVSLTNSTFKMSQASTSARIEHGQRYDRWPRRYHDRRDECVDDGEYRRGDQRHRPDHK